MNRVGRRIAPMEADLARPAPRLAAIPGGKVRPEGTWLLVMPALPAALLWLVLLGAWLQAPPAPGPLPAPAPVALPL